MSNLRQTLITAYDQSGRRKTAWERDNWRDAHISKIHRDSNVKRAIVEYVARQSKMGEDLTSKLSVDAWQSMVEQLDTRADDALRAAVASGATVKEPLPQMNILAQNTWLEDLRANLHDRVRSMWQGKYNEISGEMQGKTKRIRHLEKQVEQIPKLREANEALSKQITEVKDENQKTIDRKDRTIEEQKQRIERQEEDLKELRGQVRTLEKANQVAVPLQLIFATLLQYILNEHSKASRLTAQTSQATIDRQGEEIELLKRSLEQAEHMNDQLYEMARDESAEEARVCQRLRAQKEAMVRCRAQDSAAFEYREHEWEQLAMKLDSEQERQSVVMQRLKAELDVLVDRYGYH